MWIVVASNQLAGHAKMQLPIPVQQDWKEWASVLISTLETAESQKTLQAVRIFDQQGRPIIDEDGIYGYDAAGAIPIAPDIVQINTDQLVDAAVATAKLANQAVETINIANLAVGEAQIALLAVTSAIIGNLAVITAKIDDLAVNNAKIANLAVDSAKIDNLAVGTAKIALLAVDTAQISSAAITEAKIDDLAVTSAKIALLAVDTAQITNAAIETAKINNLAVTEAKIGALAVTKAKIGLLAVDTAQIASAAIANAKIENLAVNNAKISNLTIATGKVVDDAITKLTVVENGSAILITTSAVWTDIVSSSFTKDEASSAIALHGLVRAGQLATRGTSRMRILRDAVELELQGLPFSTVNDLQRGIIVTDSPGAGTYTYKVQIIRDSGSGNVSVVAGDGDLSIQEFKK